ncbi:MAG: sarcosine oxidase subunit alpha family protein [Rhodospirillales bacterium]|nr:sarcosine oxidase subunit alpha family protein [Rhodospirillales bacterium]MBO6785724.1 sarcosine oxidase subunit alpha family protein [Rhodospirillales bacterium]
MTSQRLKSGGLIDRNLPIAFMFDGKPYQGFAGDTLASALMANGVGLVGRSFKYHRPRGIMTAGSSEPNALVTVGEDGRTEPNCRATTVELYDGLVARSQNRWPSLGFDVGEVNALLSPFLGAGFYYKTFMWPAALWEKFYEPMIRRAAGLGRASYEPDPDHYEKCWAHCDLLVVGAGPAGLAAAMTAAQAGARVIIADEQSGPGGSLLSDRREIGGAPAPTFAAKISAELASMANVTVLSRTTVFGWYDDRVFGAVERVQKHVSVPAADKPVERLWRIVAKQCVLASGAEERPLVFGGNDRPGVMMADAARTYVNRYGVAAGSRVAVFTNNSSAYCAARDMEANGIDVAAIIDPRAETPDYDGQARVMANARVVGTRGWRGLTGITVQRGGEQETIPVDALLMSGGWNPIVSLACQRGAKPRWSDDHVAFLPPAPSDGMRTAGAAAGIASLGNCVQHGASIAVECLSKIGIAAKPFDAGPAEDEPAFSVTPLWHVAGSTGKAFVDFQNDVHTDDLGLAVREGYGHVEHTKRYTTTGMATDQGKLSNVNAIGILAEVRGTTPGDIGTTTYRPFYTPVSFGALAGAHRGRHFQPVRRSPLHMWAEKHGAEFVEVGHWYRSAWFPRSGETRWRQSVDREVLAVRRNVGICDVSTLGKIEIVGRDAAEFLNRIYCNGVAKLPVGKARYGLMLREDGFIYDDGTLSRLAENRYFMTTTTALAAGVLSHMEFCAQVLWPDLDVRFTSVSDQWAQIAIAGPRSRDLLKQIVDDDISNDAFPFLAAGTINLMGGQLSARLFRISYSGELAYELAVPASYGEAVANALMAIGEPMGVTPYGTEAMGVMRIEKGHVTHAEINGTVVPEDIGMGRMVSVKKPDFIGRRMLNREGLSGADRLKLVGLKPVDPSDDFSTGAHILNPGAAPSMAADQGHVTSTCFSPVLGHHIGLALIKRGPERIGEQVVVWDALKEQDIKAIIADPAFVDPAGERLHA